MVDDKCTCEKKVNTAFVAVNKRIDEVLGRLLKLETRLETLEEESLDISPEINIGVKKNGKSSRKNIKSK